MTRPDHLLALAAALLPAAAITALVLTAGGGGEPGAAHPTPVTAATPAAAPTEPAPTPDATPVATPGPAATPTPPPSVEREVEAAYLAYWEAYAEAALHLDASLVEGFASGAELARIRAEISALRERGVALRVVVEHDPLVVVTSEASAVVADRITNRSFHVDPATLHPPRAEGDGEVLRDTVFMEKEGGRWIAVDSHREGSR